MPPEPPLGQLKWALQGKFDVDEDEEGSEGAATPQAANTRALGQRCLQDSTGAEHYLLIPVRAAEQASASPAFQKLRASPDINALERVYLYCFGGKLSSQTSY